MRPRLTFRPLILTAPACMLAVTRAPSDLRASPSGIRFPPVVLWAWERPTDLRELSPNTGVAFLAQTLIITPTVTAIRPRRYKLLVHPDTPLLAVTRSMTALASRCAAEALARAVDGTRLGCNDDSNGSASRAAYQTLHRLFPKTEWARRTKY